MTGLSGRVSDPHTTPLSIMDATTRASAHAKAILLGEHAVVHGGPAISLPVHSLTLTATVTATDRPLWIDSVLYRGPVAAAPQLLAAPITAITATLERIGVPPAGLAVRIDGEIPAERGLGSSAAVAAAISTAVAAHHGVALDDDTRFALVQAAERVAHGNPSGLDARSVVSPGPMWFRQGASRPLPSRFAGVFVIADTGVHGRTREAVTAVGALKAAEPARIDAVLARIDAHTAAAVHDLAADDRTALGQRMSAVHDLLRELTVSSAELDALVAAAHAAGALGAKLTGGGRGGCVLALAADEPQATRVAAALRDAGAERTWLLHAAVTAADVAEADAPAGAPAVDATAKDAAE
ncbi:mevalonate kinase [Microbacterium sp.]|uniref:mevalonate kinase n=1 Tax=Microbacterium sp. TaxID=51671 RepID=UPI003A92B8CD